MYTALIPWQFLTRCFRETQRLAKLLWTMEYRGEVQVRSADSANLDFRTECGVDAKGCVPILFP